VLRGDIYLVDFGPGIGRELPGPLPAVVVSSDNFNVGPLSLIVLPGVPSASSPYRMHAVPVSAAESGLPADTAFLCYLIRAVDPSRVDPSLLGRLPAARMAASDHILLSILGLNTPPPPGPPAAPRP
jgi:mRNA interferase MazF